MKNKEYIVDIGSSNIPAINGVNTAQDRKCLADTRVSTVKKQNLESRFF